MPLEFALQQAPMRFGLAENVDPHQAPLGTLMTAENACWTRTGQIAKRLGTKALTRNIVGGGTLSSAARLITRGGELALTDGSHIYSYTATGWIDRGRLPEVGMTWSTSTETLGGIKAADSAVVGSSVVTAWVAGGPYDLQTPGTVSVQVTDVNGTLVVPPTVISPSGGAQGSRVSVISNGTLAVIVFAWSGSLYSYVMSATAPLSGTLTQLQSDVINNGGATKYTSNSLAVTTNDSSWTVAYAKSGGGIQLRTYTFASVPALQTSAVLATETSTDIMSIGLAGSSTDALYLLYADHGGGFIKSATIVPSTLATSFGPTTLETATILAEASCGVVWKSGGGALLVYSCQTDVIMTGRLTVRSASASGAPVVLRTMNFLKLVSQPFALGSSFYFLARTYTTANGFFYSTDAVIFGAESILFDATPGTIGRQVGRLDVLTAGDWFQGHLCSASALSSTQVSLSTPLVLDSRSPRAPMLQGLRAVTISIGASVPADTWRSSAMGAESYLCAGVETAYDGNIAVAYGFAHAAFIDPQESTVSSSGGQMVGGAYLYCTVPERRSAAGVLHRGPTALTQPLNVPSGSTGSTTVAVVTVPSAVCSEVSQVAFYRSVKDGTIPQRLTVEPSTALLINGYGGGTLTDTVPDASVAAVGLATRPALYTIGGELDDMQPPSALTSTVYQNRLWIVGGDGYTVWFSKDRTTNPDIAPGFNPAQTILFSHPITALAPLDSQLIAFTANRIWIVYGQGPAVTGQGGTYDVEPMQSDVGCINPRSVVSTPDGVMFQSSRGIYLLTRKLEVQFIGWPVQDELAAYSQITSAVLVASRNEVRFTATGAIQQGNSYPLLSEVIVYNYVLGQWTTSVYTADGTYGQPIADACMWQGQWVFVTTNGTVCVESATDCYDTNASGTQAWVPMTLTTAWYNAAGPLAYQSVRTFALEGASKSDHALTVACAFNNDTTFAQTFTFASGGAVTAPGPLESCEVSIGPLRKCQSIRFRVSDAAPASPSGNGAGPTLDMIGLELGVKRGFRPKPTAQTG